MNLMNNDKSMNQQQDVFLLHYLCFIIINIDRNYAFKVNPIIIMLFVSGYKCI